MNDVTVTVRLPRKLKEDVDLVVKAGHFKNVSDLIVTGVRKETEEYKVPKNLAMVRRIRKQIWDDYMKRAKGDSVKAVKLFHDETKKYEEEEPEFFKY